MRFATWLRNLTLGALKTGRRPAECRPAVEVLENRVVPSGPGDPFWTRQFGSTASDNASGMSADGSGVYVAGYTSGTLPGQTNAGGDDAFVRKYDAAGDLLWARQFGSAANDQAFGVSADGTGVYVAGLTYGTLPNQTTTGGIDAFVVKYDTNGNRLWTRQFGSADYDVASRVSADGTGVYVAGETGGTLLGQTSAGSSDAFVARFDANGTILWTRQFGSADFDSATGVSADGTGVYVAGATTGALPGQTKVSPANFSDAFVVKYDAAGNLLWTRQFGPAAGSDTARGVSADGSGVYVAGVASGSLLDQTFLGGTDAFVARYDAAGDLLWARQFGSATDDDASGVSADGSGVYVAGRTLGALRGQTNAGGDDAFVVEYDGNGNPLWTRQFGGAAADDATGVSADGSGVYVVGQTSGALPGQANTGDADAFVAKFRTANDAPPVIGSLTISSSTPGGVVATTSVLTALVIGYDPDGEAVGHAYRWYLNGKAIAGATAATLNLGKAGYHRGDLITVRVIPSDFSATGAAAFARVTVFDAPPVIRRLTVSSSGPGGAVTTASVLTARVLGYDPDGEAVGYRYQWYRNGTVISGATAAALDLRRPGHGGRGDVITVRVTPYDASAIGAVASSPGVRVVSAAAVVAAYRRLEAGYSFDYAAYLRLGTLAAHTAWVYASYAWARARYAYTVDGGSWGRAAFSAALAYQTARSIYQSSGNSSAHAAYVFGYSGWLDARAAAAP